jgi:hypothetical protein
LQDDDCTAADISGTAQPGLQEKAAAAAAADYEPRPARQAGVQQQGQAAASSVDGSVRRCCMVMCTAAGLQAGWQQHRGLEHELQAVNAAELNGETATAAVMADSRQ